MLSWAQQFNIFCFLDSNQYNEDGDGYDYLLAAGARSCISATGQSFIGIDNFTSDKEWVFGHLSYELKSIFFPASPVKGDKVSFPAFFFFEPEIVLTVKNNQLIIYGAGDDASQLFALITNQRIKAGSPLQQAGLKQRISREKYIETIRQLKHHIQVGDCYEINFCQEFYAEGFTADPLFIYNALAEISPAPFAGFYKVDENYLICASPERFLSKKGNTLMAQPMKGTYRRGAGLPASDSSEKEQLRVDVKERSENVMIVDLMRNDLSRVCTRGSVKVTELYGVYTFPQVHQMVSTIKGELPAGTGFYRIMEATFPMGSMTGAPKHRVLELIDKYENRSRGIFSGALGYFHKGDFDFNVVIRSVMFNNIEKYLSVKVGSGITIYCDAENEWEECMIKVEAIKKVLTGRSALQGKKNE
jgi:para-aminobenzoate synthetase component I